MLRDQQQSKENTLYRLSDNILSFPFSMVKNIKTSHLDSYNGMTFDRKKRELLIMNQLL